MNEQTPKDTVAAAKLAAEERRKAEAKIADEREAQRQRAKAKVDAAMAGVVQPEIHVMIEALKADDVSCENGWGADRYGNRILTLRLRTKPFPPALVFTADTAGPNPRLTWHEELGHGVKEPRRTEIEEPEREAVGKVISDFLMRAM
jgi:hypothetical protein